MPRRRWLLPLLVGTVWLLAVGAGLVILWKYSLTPGTPAVPPDLWPAESRIRRSLTRPTLVMLAHPHCPCTRASVGELARLMTRCQGLITAHVLFFEPPDAPEGWGKTDLWRSAGAIPGVDVLEDESGVEARRFGATTSGQTVLYDRDGRLLFRGGITGARGHAGDNAGSSAIVSLLTGRTVDRMETSVFGCALLDPPSDCVGEGAPCTN